MNEEDFAITENKKALFAIDPISLDFVKGSLIDYEDEIIRQGFVV